MKQFQCYDLKKLAQCTMPLPVSTIFRDDDFLENMNLCLCIWRPARPVYFWQFFLQLFHLQLFNSLRWLSLADRTKQLHTRWSQEGTERTQPTRNVPI